MSPEGKWFYLPDGSVIRAYRADPRSGSIRAGAVSSIGSIDALAMHPTGRYIAIRTGSKITMYRTRGSDGSLVATSATIDLSVISALQQMQFAPDGEFLHLPSGIGVLTIRFLARDSSLSLIAAAGRQNPEGALAIDYGGSFVYYAPRADPGAAAAVIFGFRSPLLESLPGSPYTNDAGPPPSDIETLPLNWVMVGRIQ
jgi:hypothetical protein